MNTYTVLLLCIQACLVQNVFGQYLGAAGCGCGLNAIAAPAATIASSIALPQELAAGYGYNGLGAAGLLGNGIGLGYGAINEAYGGVGEGNVAVSGELPVVGNTAIVGQVPIIGAVVFDGVVPAAGAVSISGNCACGCGGIY